MPKTIPFWTQDFSVLLNKNYIFELWPQYSMCYEQKMNAISRLVIIICILGYVTTMNIKFILVGIVTLAAIIFVYSKKLGIKEGMEDGEGAQEENHTDTHENNEEDNKNKDQPETEDKKTNNNNNNNNNNKNRVATTPTPPTPR